MSRDPVPPADKLRPEDCAPAAVEYRRRLERQYAGQAGGPQEIERRVADFTTECQQRLAGQVRRVVIRCWRDALDAASFISCNERF